MDRAIVCWTKVGTGLALDDIGLAQDWNRIGMDFSLFDIGLVLNWHQIVIGSGTGLALD